MHCVCMQRVLVSSAGTSAFWIVGRAVIFCEMDCANHSLLHACYNIAVIIDTCSVSLLAALVFAGSLQELTRIGVMAWLHDERYERDARTNLKSWGKTLWTMWKMYHKG